MSDGRKMDKSSIQPFNGEIDDTRDNKPSLIKKGNQEYLGQIPSKLGTGENAKNSFVYIVLLWSFILGAVLCASLFILYLVNDCKSGAWDIQSLVKEYINIWNIFIPLITLALGYAFGKSRK